MKRRYSYQYGGITPMNSLLGQQGIAPFILNEYQRLFSGRMIPSTGNQQSLLTEPANRSQDYPRDTFSFSDSSKSKSSDKLYEKEFGGKLKNDAESSGGGFDLLGNIGNISGVASGVQGLFDNNRFNQGSSAGSAIGSGVDLALNAIPGIGPVLSKLGIGNKLGTWVGGKFDAQPPSSYTPSGNTTGNFKDYQTGGYLGRKYDYKYPEGKKAYAEYYYDPKQAEYLAGLEKEYNLPEGSLAAITYKETGRAKKVDNKWQYSPTPNLTSPAGAQGMFQFMPEVAKSRGIDPNNFEQAARAAAEKLRNDFERTGSWMGTLASYNAGRGRWNQYEKDGRPLPKETQDYIPKFFYHREQYTGYPNSLPYGDIPTVIAPGPNSPTVMNRQAGGTVAPEVEIEGEEYVFSPQGIDENKFKMLDSKGKEHKSPFGFLAKGDSHDEGGIKVSAQDGYIASSHLGLDGKKSGKGNPSVAKIMLERGGKALSKGFDNKWDKRGVNEWNPGALKHHLTQMEQVKEQAEKGKFLQGKESDLDPGQAIDTLTDEEVMELYQTVVGTPQAKRGGCISDYIKRKIR